MFPKELREDTNLDLLRISSAPKATPQSISSMFRSTTLPQSASRSSSSKPRTRPTTSIPITYPKPNQHPHQQPNPQPNQPPFHTIPPRPQSQAQSPYHIINFNIHTITITHLNSLHLNATTAHPRLRSNDSIPNPSTPPYHAVPADIPRSKHPTNNQPNAA